MWDLLFRIHQYFNSAINLKNVRTVFFLLDIIMSSAGKTVNEVELETSELPELQELQEVRITSD